MKILIGYHQRSGSTLLQHILNGHSQIKSYSDISSLLVIPPLLSGYQPDGNVCVKPLDVFYMFESEVLHKRFDKFIWLARDPRDSYLSALEVGFAYNFWFPGRKLHGIDVGLLQRWKKVYRSYFCNQGYWHLLRYEDLVTRPRRTLRKLFRYLEVPFEAVYPFKKFNIWTSGGDPKLRKTKTIHNKSISRYEDQMTKRQQRIFRWFLFSEMKQLGYVSVNALMKLRIKDLLKAHLPKLDGDIRSFYFRFQTVKHLSV